MFALVAGLVFYSEAFRTICVCSRRVTNDFGAMLRIALICVLAPEEAVRKMFANPGRVLDVRGIRSCPSQCHPQGCLFQPLPTYYLRALAEP